MMPDMLFLFLLRCAVAALTAFALGWLAIRLFLHLSGTRLSQPIRELGPSSHQSKVGTPTLAGLPMVLAATVAILLWRDESATVLWYLASLLAFAAIGLLDDLVKIRNHQSGGINVRTKLACQFFASLLLLAGVFTASSSAGTSVFIPFIGEIGDTGPFPVLLWYFASLLLLVFISNAVNLSDGLDGLIAVPVLLVALALGVLGLLADPLFALSEHLPALPGGRGTLLVASALSGVLLAFLWFNAPPARIFMGDTGALALGGVLGMFAIQLNQHLLLLLMGAVFVLEAVSVLLQVGWFKYSGGKRIFRMAPFHHHLELAGWPETTIMVRFWVITAVLTLLALTVALWPGGTSL